MVVLLLNFLFKWPSLSRNTWMCEGAFRRFWVGKSPNIDYPRFWRKNPVMAASWQRILDLIRVLTRALTNSLIDLEKVVNRWFRLKLSGCQKSSNREKLFPKFTTNSVTPNRRRRRLIRNWLSHLHFFGNLLQLTFDRQWFNVWLNGRKDKLRDPLSLIFRA